MQKSHHKIQEQTPPISIEEKKESTRFSLRLFKIVSLETEGYTYEQNREYVRDILSFRRLWPVILIAAALAAMVYRFADGILWIKSLFDIPP